MKKYKVKMILLPELTENINLKALLDHKNYNTLKQVVLDKHNNQYYK